jgi:hypothetical protein
MPDAIRGGKVGEGSADAGSAQAETIEDGVIDGSTP